MGSTFFTDLRDARSRPELADRARVELRRDPEGPGATAGRVREARIPPLAPPAGSGSLADLPFANAERDPSALALKRQTGPGSWQPVSAESFARDVADTARGLLADGLEAGQRVAVMSRTRYEWAVLDFAVWAAGGQVVPIYPTSSAEQVAWIVQDSQAVRLFAENAEQAAVAEEGIAAAGAAQGPVPVHVIDPERNTDTVPALPRLAEAGRAIPESRVAERRGALTPDTIATLIYTSGTTGRPKGCVLTHANLQNEAANVVELALPVFRAVTREQPSTLMFLPMAHVLGRSLVIACLIGGITVGLYPSIKPDELRPELKAFSPSLLIAVPYFFEKVHDTARAMAENLGRGSSFVRADRIAVDYGRAEMDRLLDRGPGPGLGLRLAHRLYDLLVYRRVRKELGGRVRYAISGSSALDPRLSLFFFGCGLLIYEGYGLTETSAAATVTPPLGPRLGTVGQPVPGTAVRIADDGEVLISGGIVSREYWRNPAATKESRELADGQEWFATGDLGELDEDGYLTIVGRKKDILITSGGKNVSPSQLEDRLRSRPPIGQVMVVGDGRKYISALITLEPESVQHWLAHRKRPAGTSLAELREDPDLVADVQAAVDYANLSVSRAESIRRFRILDTDWTVENGLLTPSLKVKRHEVTDRFADEIAGLYDAEGKD
jgi:long-chain acyl-CoA synthetase